jgi:hypothetical protein
MEESEVLPAGTYAIRMILMGTRNVGTDNDSYFDEMFVKLELGTSGCEEFVPVGIAESPNNKGVAVYPNPFTDEATIEVVKPSRNSTYSLAVFDRAGREIQRLQSTSGKFIIQGSELSSGMYFYQVSDGDWYSTGKLVVN